MRAGILFTHDNVAGTLSVFLYININHISAQLVNIIPVEGNMNYVITLLVEGNM